MFNPPGFFQFDGTKQAVGRVFPAPFVDDGHHPVSSPGGGGALSSGDMESGPPSKTHRRVGINAKI